jgi:hypothetical protein
MAVSDLSLRIYRFAPIAKNCWTCPATRAAFSTQSLSDMP